MGLKEDMMNMGFGENRTARALQAVQYSSLEHAIAWLEAHENDPDIDDPVEESAGNVLGSAADPSHTSAPVTEDGPVPLTEEEKAAKAAAVQAKIAERRKIAEEKDKEEAVMREKIRRKEGQSLAEMREKRRDDDMKALAEERRKQKVDDERAKREVLENIKRDRAAKVSKTGDPPPPPKTNPVVTPPAPKTDYNECKLQLRLPSGQPVVNCFKAEDTLGEVVAFIRECSGLDSFRLMTSFPRKQYQPTDYGFTLKSLGLCPSSVIIVSKQ